MKNSIDLDELTNQIKWLNLDDNFQLPVNNLKKLIEELNDTRAIAYLAMFSKFNLNNDGYNSIVHYAERWYLHWINDWDEKDWNEEDSNEEE